MAIMDVARICSGVGSTFEKISKNIEKIMKKFWKNLEKI